MVQINFQALIDKESELTENISLLSEIKKESAKALVKKLAIELASVTETIAKNQKAIDLQKLQGESLFESFCKDLRKVMSKHAIDYNVRCAFDYNFANGLVTVASLRPATIRGKNGNSVVIYTGAALPDVLPVRIEKDAPVKEYQLVNTLDPASEFSTMESAFQNVLACYGDLLADVEEYNSTFEQNTSKKSRFASARASDKLTRLTQKAYNMLDFFNVKSIASDKDKASATEAASQALGEHEDAQAQSA